MPFWTLFWLIVPAVLLLSASVAWFARTGHHDRGTDPIPPRPPRRDR